MNANPEQSVLDAIDALVDEQMAGGEIAAERRAEVIASDIDRCALCKGAWHGTRGPVSTMTTLASTTGTAMGVRCHAPARSPQGRNVFGTAGATGSTGPCGGPWGASKPRCRGSTGTRRRSTNLSRR